MRKPEFSNPDFGKDNNEVKVKKVKPDQWQKYRDMRIKAIQEEPLAFLIEDPMTGEFQDVLKDFETKGEKEWRGMLEDTGRLHTAVEKDGEFIAGATGIRMGAGQGFLGDIYVSAKERGQGIGREIVKETIEQLKKKDKNLWLVKLTVFDDQKPAIKLYESLGFKTVKTEGKSATYQGRHLVEHTMELVIDKK